MTTRVLIVDDQPMYRAGLTAILGAEEDITVVGDAADGEEAIARNRVLHPDVVLMDVRMPTMNGIDATRHLTHPTGASGFLLKDADGVELTNAVRVVARGDSLLAPRVTRRLIENFVAHKPAGLTPTTVFNALTEREREVFLLIATGRSNAEIGRELFMAEQTAKSHVSRIMSKLHLRDRIHAVMLAYDTGLVTPSSSS